MRTPLRSGGRPACHRTAQAEILDGALGRARLASSDNAAGVLATVRRPVSSTQWDMHSVCDLYTLVAGADALRARSATRYDR
jgi:hypothetical protein